MGAKKTLRIGSKDGYIGPSQKLKREILVACVKQEVARISGQEPTEAEKLLLRVYHEQIFGEISLKNLLDLYLLTAGNQALGRHQIDTPENTIDYSEQVAAVYGRYNKVLGQRLAVNFRDADQEKQLKFFQRLEQKEEKTRQTVAQEQVGLAEVLDKQTWAANPQYREMLDRLQLFYNERITENTARLEAMETLGKTLSREQCTRYQAEAEKILPR